MFGCYQRRWDKQKIAEAFALGNVDGLALELTPDYNVAPPDPSFTSFELTRKPLQALVTVLPE